MLGYVDETGEPALPPGRYYRTGDLARRDVHGCFHLIGRGDDVFKSYDVRISPVEIECTLRRILSSRILRCSRSTTSSANSSRRQRSCRRLPATPDRCRPICSGGSANGCHDPIGSCACTVEGLPKTLSGKTNRAALRQRFASDNSVSISFS